MKVSAQAARVLRRAVRFIRTHPRNFSMADWITHDPSVKGKKPWCGTVACLAGVIALLEKPRRAPEALHDACKIALRALGAGRRSTFKAHQVADALFYAERWPEPFKSRYFAGRRSSALAARVEHYIKTGE